jgi:hypothetical protein
MWFHDQWYEHHFCGVISTKLQKKSFKGNYLSSIVMIQDCNKRKKLLSEERNKKKENFRTVSILRRSSAAVHISLTAIYQFVTDPYSLPQNLLFYVVFT